MGYEDKSFENILAEMKDMVLENHDIDTSEGTIVHDALAPSAFQFMQMYMYLQAVENNAYGDTANEEYLERMASERGIDREQATYSNVIAEIPGISNVIGYTFKSEDDIYYEVINDLGDGQYRLRCKTAGSIGNRINLFLQPVDNIVNFNSCKIVSIDIYAQDKEELEVFRERYLKSFRTHRFGGNKTDYIEKTMEVDGVGSCTVVPAKLSANGSINDITVYIRGEDYTEATETLVNKVQQVLDPNQDGMGDGWCPIGHRCFVKASQKIDLGLRLDIRAKSQSVNVNILKEQCKTAIQNYLKERFKNVYAEVKYIYDSDIIKVLKSTVDEVLDVDVEFSTTYEPNYVYKDLIKINDNCYPSCDTITVKVVTTQTGW